MEKKSSNDGTEKSAKFYRDLFASLYIALLSTVFVFSLYYVGTYINRKGMTKSINLFYNPIYIEPV